MCVCVCLCWAKSLIILVLCMHFSLYLSIYSLCACVYYHIDICTPMCKCTRRHIYFQAYWVGFCSPQFFLVFLPLTSSLGFLFFKYMCCVYVWLLFRFFVHVLCVCVYVYTPTYIYVHLHTFTYTCRLFKGIGCVYCIWECIVRTRTSVWLGSV